MTASILLPRPLVNELLQHAQDSETFEVCGLISSRDGHAHRCYRIDNIAANRDCRYQMDPAQQIAALKFMREHDETLFAIYHSHPGSPAVPSRTDIAEAGYPDALYLIISLNTKGVLEMRGFYVNGDTVTEVELEIGD